MHSTGLPSLTVSALTAGGKPPAVLIVSASVADWGARASPALGLPWCGVLLLIRTVGSAQGLGPFVASVPCRFVVSVLCLCV